MTTKVKTKVASGGGDEVLDIPGATLVEWLMARKKLAPTWKKNYPRLLKLIEGAQAAEEAGERRELNYYDCQRLFKEHEARPGGSATSFFGSYTSAGTQRWYEVVSLYEKDNLYIGETCQRYTQNVNYEIPDARKMIERTEKGLEDVSKRETDATKSKNNSINVFKKAISDLGIKGDSIREEIEALPSQLSPIFEEVAEYMQKTASIKAAIEFYKEILQLTKAEFAEASVLPITSYIIQNGNTLLLQREKEINPEQYKDIALETGGSKVATKNSEGVDSGLTSGNTIEIDWCMDIESDSKALEERADQGSDLIVWEDGMDVSSPSIQWDDFSMDTIELVDETPSATLDPPQKDKKAKAKEKEKEIDVKRLKEETLLSDNITRNQFLDEIYEMEMFLTYRVQEMEASSSVFGLDSVNSESSVSANSLREYLAAFQEISKRLSNQRIKKILEIKSSKKFIERLALSFSQKQSNITKYSNLLLELDVKRNELTDQFTQAKQRLDKLTQQTRQLKSDLEPLLSTKLFDKKRVNIILKL